MSERHPPRRDARQRRRTAAPPRGSARRQGGARRPVRRPTSPAAGRAPGTAGGDRRRTQGPSAPAAHRGTARLAKRRQVRPIGQRRASGGGESGGRGGLRQVIAPPPAAAPSRLRAGKPRRRLIGALLALIIVLGGLLVRVGQLQTTQAAELRDSGAVQWTRSEEIPPQRGSIFDRNGNELTMSVPARTIAANPRQIANEDGTAAVLAQILELDDDDRDALAETFGDKDRGFAYVARQVDPGYADQVDALGLTGVHTYREDRRVKPGGDTGNSVLGVTDIDGQGIGGLEAQYDDLLAGAGGEVSRHVAPGGRSIPGSEQVVTDATPGGDIVTTIDRSVQFAAEQGLLDRIAEIGARGGNLIIMDTDTGELLAMASVQRTDDGDYVVASGNYAAVHAYEPGSVAKVMAIAAGLNEGAVTPQTTFDVPMQKRYFDSDPRPVTDSTSHGPVMTVEDILVLSSNIGTVTVQEQIGTAKHVEYMERFGMGAKSAIDFPGESTGILRPAEELRGLETKTVAYGYGFSATSIQLAAMMNTFANDGVYVEPTLVQATLDSEGELLETPDAERHRVVKPRVARQMTHMMKGVVCRGTAQRAQVPGLSIAGKTGTGWKAQPDGGYEDEDGNRAYYATFAGYFPAEDPEVTMLVSIDEPPPGSSERFGGSAAAPVFEQLAPMLVSELQISPPAGSTGCEEG